MSYSLSKYGNLIITLTAYCGAEMLFLLFGFAVLPVSNTVMLVLTMVAVASPFLGEIVELKIAPLDHFNRSWFRQPLVRGSVYFTPLSLAYIGRIYHSMLIISVVVFASIVLRVLYAVVFTTIKNKQA